MNEEGVRTTFAHPTPELPVEDVELAQQHYRDALGFQIGWLHPGGDIGAVSRDDVAIFFRRRMRPFEPAVHWVLAAGGYVRINGLGISDSVHYEVLPLRAERIFFSTRDTALVADRSFTLLAATIASATVAPIPWSSRSRLRSV